MDQWQIYTKGTNDEKMWPIKKRTTESYCKRQIPLASGNTVSDFQVCCAIIKDLRRRKQLVSFFFFSFQTWLAKKHFPSNVACRQAVCISNGDQEEKQNKKKRACLPCNTDNKDRKRQPSYTDTSQLYRALSPIIRYISIYSIRWSIGFPVASVCALSLHGIYIELAMGK